MAANPSKLPMPSPAHAGLLLKLPWWEVKPAQAGSGTHHWFFNPSEKPASAKPRWWVRDQSCAIATKLQKEWLVFLSYKCVEKGRKKNSLISPEGLYGLLLCRRILTEGSCSFPKTKHFSVIYFPGWLQKQDLDGNVDGFSAGTSLEPMCIPAAISWACCGQEVLECPRLLLPHAQPLTSPLHHSEAQTHKTFLQLFEGFRHPPSSRRKTQLK